MKRVVALGWLLVASGVAWGQPRSHSLYDPHPIPTDRPWLEGWYTRIVDPAWGGSLAVLAGTCASPEGVAQPGYAAILVQAPGAERLEVYEAFPPATEHRLPDGPVTRAPRVRGEAAFTWRADVGRFGPGQVSLTLPGGASLEASFERPLAWNGGGPDRGPEGLMVHVPWLTQHWFVHSVGSRVRYVLRRPGHAPREGVGWAHQEKNWGSDFPSRWVWAQGLHGAPGQPDFAQFALAGGEARLRWGDAEEHAREEQGWLLGVRLGARRAAFRVPGDHHEVRSDPADGSLELILEGARERARVRLRAPAASFVGVSVPTALGFRQGARESFRARAELELWERPRPGAAWTPAGAAGFDGAALEFGDLPPATPR